MLGRHDTVVVCLKHCGVASDDDNDDQIDIVKHDAYSIADDELRTSTNPKFYFAEHYQQMDGRLVGMR